MCSQFAHCFLNNYHIQYFEGIFFVSIRLPTIGKQCKRQMIFVIFIHKTAKAYLFLSQYKTFSKEKNKRKEFVHKWTKNKNPVGTTDFINFKNF